MTTDALLFAGYSLAVLLFGMFLPQLYAAAANELTMWRMRRDIMRRIARDQAVKDAAQAVAWAINQKRDDLQA